MDEVRLLEEKFGGWWCAESPRRPPDALLRRDCCVAHGSDHIDTTQLLNCPGGSRSLGWNTEEETIAQAMAEKTGTHRVVARKVLRSTPRLKDGLGEVIVGTYEAPDVVVSFSQPEAAMKLLRA